MKPICVKCRRFYRIKKGGFYFIEGMPRAGVAALRVGDSDWHNDANWQDYKLWSGDLWECKGCGHQLVSGVGLAPVRERHHEDFAAMKEGLGAHYRVNDC